MADSIADIGFVDERRDIDADFAHLYEIMESRSFRTNSGWQENSRITSMTTRPCRSLKSPSISSSWRIVCRR